MIDRSTLGRVAAMYIDCPTTSPWATSSDAQGNGSGACRGRAIVCARAETCTGNHSCVTAVVRRGATCVSPPRGPGGGARECTSTIPSMKLRVNNTTTGIVGMLWLWVPGRLWTALELWSPAMAWWLKEWKGRGPEPDLGLDHRRSSIGLAWMPTPTLPPTFNPRPRPPAPNLIASGEGADLKRVPKAGDGRRRPATTYFAGRPILAGANPFWGVFKRRR